MIFGKPIEQYQPADTDITGTTNYYGFMGPHAAWYIMKEVVNGTLTAYTYVTGTGTYTDNWTNRASLTYLSFDLVFKW